MATQNINTEQDASKGACAAGCATDTRQRLILGGRYAFINYGKAQEMAQDAQNQWRSLTQFANAFAAIGDMFKSDGNYEKNLSGAACDGIAFICQMLCNKLYEIADDLDTDALNFLRAIHFDHVTDARNAELAARGVVERGAENE